MNKSDLIEALKEEADLTRAKAAEVVNLLFDKMTDALANRDRVEIRGFCSIFVKEYKAYTGRNPKTRESVEVPPKKLPFFNVEIDIGKSGCSAKSFGNALDFDHRIHRDFLRPHNMISVKNTNMMDTIKTRLPTALVLGLSPLRSKLQISTGRVTSKRLTSKAIMNSSQDRVNERKNEAIKASLNATKARRRHQSCRVFTVKLDKSHLNTETLHHLRMLFLQAKWLYNHILAQPNVFEVDYKLSAVPVKVKDTFERRHLNHLSSHMKQSLITRTMDNIRGLARLKEQGHKIGSLKFKSAVDSIPLKQYGNTYRILNEKYLRIQGIRQHLRVNGLGQIPYGSELANATLIHRHGDYYVAITSYQAKGQNTPLPPSPPAKTVGIDFGLKTQLTLSDGIAIRYAIPLSLSKRLRRLHQQLSRQQYRSNNWYHTRRQLEKAYARLSDIKQDIQNKLVHYLQATYGIVCYQDENLKGWQRLWGGKTLSTSLGGLIEQQPGRNRPPLS